jgi:hypothetical protein
MKWYHYVMRLGGPSYCTYILVCVVALTAVPINIVSVMKRLIQLTYKVVYFIYFFG